MSTHDNKELSDDSHTACYQGDDGPAAANVGVETSLFTTPSQSGDGESVREKGRRSRCFPPESKRRTIIIICTTMTLVSLIAGAVAVGVFLETKPKTTGESTRFHMIHVQRV